MAPRMYAVCHQPAKHWTGVRGPPLPSKEGNAKYAVTCRSAAAASARMCYSAVLCCAVLRCAVHDYVWCNKRVRTFLLVPGHSRGMGNVLTGGLAVDVMWSPPPCRVLPIVRLAENYSTTNERGIGSNYTSAPSF